MLRLAFVLCLVACASDAEKLDKLSLNKTIKCLNEQASWEKYLAESDSLKRDTIRGEWARFRAECELATRKYEGFGR